jgi:hypothetical protein
LKEAKAISVEIYGDSELVIKQLNGQYECRNDILRNYYEECKEILKSFQLVILQHIPREHNEEANRLAQSASGYRENQEVFANDICSFESDLAEDDWRKEVVDYLENPSRKVSRKLRYKAIKFVLLYGRLYYKSLDGVLLQCLGQEEAKKMMSEVHDGLCGAHQSAYRMKWVIRQTGCYLPMMLEDCFEYYKGFSIEQYLWLPNEDFFADSTPRGKSLCAARVLGEGPRGCGGGFIGGSGSSCARGPCWGGGPEAEAAARGLSPRRTRLEVGDDGWPPPVIRRRQRRRGERAGWASSARWAGPERPAREGFALFLFFLFLFPI